MSRTQRRMSARRGSVSASDPFGQHASLNHDSNRSSSSTLTIVRVLDPSSQAGPTGNGASSVKLSDPPAPVLHRRSLRHPGGTTPSTSADSSAGRLSFAFSSFTPNSSASNSSSTAGSSSAVVTPGRRASSPSPSPRLRSSSPSQFSRRLSSSGASPFTKPNLSPDQLVDLARQSTSPRYVPPSLASMPSTSHPPALPSPGGTAPAAGPLTAPATFTPLPADVYLPFVDRPAEVTQLLSTPPTAKLFSLLAQTFPRKQDPEIPIDPTFSTDPLKWTFGTLRLWLTTVDRQSVNDALWVRNARKCVLSHSELIWERLKGALGVPPELEIDGEDDANSAIEEDDFPVDIPIAPIQTDVFENLDTSYTSLPTSDEPASQDDSMSSSPSLVPLISPSPTHLSIEPILATLASNTGVSTTGSVHLPPLSLPSTLSQSTSLAQVDGLQDIGEEAEDEDCTDTEGRDIETQPVNDSSQIHGLRISTSPAPSSPAIAPQSFSYPASPVVNFTDSGSNSADLKLSSEFFHPLTRRRSRTSSHGSVSSLGRPTFSSYTHGHGYSAGSDFGDNDSERAYDPVGDRAPGNPLFPSNFARLALGPTLTANNPNLRSSRSPQPAHSRFAKWAPGGRPPSWVDIWDPSKHEYAATIASGSSVGVGSGE